MELNAQRQKPSPTGSQPSRSARFESYPRDIRRLPPAAKFESARGVQSAV